MIIGINDLGLHAILRDTKQMQHSFKFDQIEWLQKKDDPAVEVKIRSNSRILLFKTKQVDYCSTVSFKGTRFSALPCSIAAEFPCSHDLKRGQLQNLH